MAEFEHDVIIIGGGPTGMMLAGELTLAGVDVAIVEKRLGEEPLRSRGGGLHARTIEVLDQRGIADRFLAEGKAMQVNGFGGTPLDISDFPSRHPYGLALWQNHSERILAGWIDELEVPILRGHEVVDFTQDEAGVDITLADGEQLRAQYLVGCDGGRSLVRKLAGIDFPGWDPSMSWIIAEAQMSEEPAWGFRENAAGSHAIGKVEEGGAAVRLVLTDPEVKRGEEPSLADVRAALRTIYGTDFGIHSPVWISRFTDMTRQAASYRERRVLLAGDAAHVHPPIGGQGLNIGVQDAVNLGWKLAQVVRGISPESLLDTYHAERHPVAARVLKMTMAQTALRRVDERTKALTGILSELVGMGEPRKRLGAELSGLGVHYDLGEGHPLLGRRMPDLDLVTADGPVRVFSLLRQAQPAFVSFGEPGAFDIGPWTDRVQFVEAQYSGPWELPVLGPVSAPAGVLVRPDGYVAWVGEYNDARLADALATWFGPPAAVQRGWQRARIGRQRTRRRSGEIRA